MNRDAEHALSQSDAEAMVSQWLTDYLATLFLVDRRQIDPTASFQRFGLDSATAVAMSGELEEWLGCRLDPAVAFEHPTIAQLSRALAADARVHAALCGMPQGHSKLLETKRIGP